ncbi:MAG TPA: NifU family protein [Candidatus Limnocylindrales bacterium]|nr:NifU family protein [Candidatus Limnocylindrales bacterium]
MADLEEKVARKLDEMRPYLERSGGHVDLVGVEDGIAQIVFALTRPRTSRLVVSLQMKSGIERALREAIPELRGVEAVNLPPHTLIGWDQPGLRPVDVAPAADPTKADGGRSPD